MLDADLQDPPEVILDMAAKWQEGYEVVYAVRQQRPGETRFKTMTATAFYDPPAPHGQHRANGGCG